MTEEKPSKEQIEAILRKAKFKWYSLESVKKGVIEGFKAGFKAGQEAEEKSKKRD